MIDIVQAAEGALALGFVAVTLLVLRARRRRSLPALGWLAASFASLAVGTAFGRQLVAPVEAGPLVDATLHAARAVAFFPAYFVVRFLHQIEPAPRWVLRVTAVGAWVPAAVVLLGLGNPAATMDARGWELALGAGFAVTSVAGHLWVAARLVSASVRIDASVLRRRLRTMAGAVTSTGSLNVLAFVATPAGALTSRVSAFAAVVLLWFAIQPPTALRLVARHRDSERVRATRRALLRATEPEAVADELVRSVSSLTGAEAAWLHHRGAIIAQHRIDDATAAAHDAIVRAVAGTGFASRALVRIPGSSSWVAAVPIDRGWLAVRTTPYTPVFGTDELRTLDEVADDLDLALERTRVQARERDALRRLEQAARLKDDFLSTMSHELRTPLTSIRGFSELLLTSGDALDAEARRDLLGRVVRNAGDLERLLTGLLQLTSLRDGARPTRTGLHAMDRVIDTAVRRSAVACEQHPLRLEVADDLLLVDAEAIADAVEQLVRNAAQFSPAGSPINVRGSVADGWYVIEVEDHGVGMSPAEVDELFAPFSRAGDVLTRGTRGAGVGLAIVTGIAELIGGDVSVTSQPNEGSTFRLRVPALDRPAARAPVHDLSRARGAASHVA